MIRIKGNGREYLLGCVVSDKVENAWSEQDSWDEYMSGSVPLISTYFKQSGSPCFV